MDGMMQATTGTESRMRELMHSRLSLLPQIRDNGADAK